MVPNSALAIYRGWKELVLKSGDIARSHDVLVADLAPRTRFHDFETELSVNEQFRAILSSPELSQNSQLKINQSLFFLSNDDESELTQNTVVNLGAEVTDVRSDEVYQLIEKSRDAKMRQFQCPSPFAESELVDQVVKIGLQFYRSIFPEMNPISYILQPYNPTTRYSAMAKTIGDGKLVYLLPEKVAAHPKFIFITLHEVLGHILHFEQLRANNDLVKSAPELLALSMHAQDHYFIEAISQFLVLYFLENTTVYLPMHNEVLSEAYMHAARMAIAHKVVAEIIFSRIDLDRAVNLHLSYEQLPIEILKKNTMAIIGSNVFAKNILDMYGSFKAISPLLRKSPSQMSTILPDLLGNYFSPVELQDFVKTRC